VGQSCLSKFQNRYEELNITSVAFPWIGATNGGLPWNQVHALIRQYLKDPPNIDIEVIEFDADASDPLYRVLRRQTKIYSQEEFAQRATITRHASAIIFENLEHTPSLARVCETPGIGKTTIENLYSYLLHNNDDEYPQRKLF